MTQDTIGQRINFLMNAQNLSIRKFARLLDVSDTNIRNYINRDSKPSSDVLEKLMQTFESINPMWLLTGKGEPFTTGATMNTSSTAHIKKSTGIAINNINNGTALQNISLEDCKRNLIAAESELQQLKAQLANEEAQLASTEAQLAGKDMLLAAKDDLIAAKEEMLVLLRAGHNRPN